MAASIVITFLDILLRLGLVPLVYLPANIHQHVFHSFFVMKDLE